jgi:periplasmic protein TonB
MRGAITPSMRSPENLWTAVTFRALFHKGKKRGGSICRGSNGLAEKEGAQPLATPRNSLPREANKQPLNHSENTPSAEAGDEIEQNSAAPLPAAESGGKASARELDASQRYALELKQLLDRRKTYPAPARRLGKQGRVHVRLTLSHEGNVMSAIILESSSHEILDEAARELQRP